MERDYFPDFPWCRCHGWSKLYNSKRVQQHQPVQFIDGIATSMTVTVGTDCSGLDAVREALGGHGGLSYEFASDICPVVQMLLRTPGHFNPRLVFGDITSRPMIDVPTVDLYVAGFPCQPYSNLGSREGLADPRSNVLSSVIGYIRTKRPRAFVLENVKSLLSHDRGQTWLHVWSLLQSLDGYRVEFKVMSPHEFGWPQVRPRLFIVGITNAMSFRWPSEVQKVNIETLLLPFETALLLRPTCSRQLAPSYARSLEIVIHRAKAKNQDLLVEPHVVMIGQSKGWEETGTRELGVAPCLTTHSENVYLPFQRRFLVPEEALLLQGFSMDHPVTKLSANRIRILAGNSIHVGLLKLIISPILTELEG